VFLQYQLAFDAQELRNVPLFVPDLAARQNLIDRREPLAHFVCLAETSRKLAQQRQKARQESGVAGLIKFVAQEGQPRIKIAAPGHDHGVEGPCPKPPNANRVTLGMFEQSSTVALGGVKIAGPEGDRA